VSTGTTAAVSISGTAPSQSLSFVLQPGPTGPANSLSIGSVSTGTTAAVSISGTAPSQSLSFVLPQGPQGPATTLQIGTVVTGVDAAATLTGTGLTQTLNLVLPQGATGAQGIQGIQGEVGPANSLSVGSVSVTTAATAAVSITGNAPSQQISFVIPQGPQGPQGDGGPYTTVQVGSVATGAAGSSAKIDTVTSGGTVTLNFTIPRGADGTSSLADETPQPLGVASAGSALTAARADHVHSVPVISYTNLTNVPLTFAPAAHQHAVSDVTGLQAALDGKQAAGSYATLVGGLVPSSQLPTFLDDVREAASLSAFPGTGDAGVVYVAVDTRKIYRWSGSAYVELASAPVQSVAGRTGTITLAHLGSSGTASSTTFLRGDGAWAAAGSTNAGDITSGTLAAARLPLATTTAAGAVIVGNGLSVTDGVLAASGSGGSGGVVTVASIAALPATGAANVVYLAINSSRFYRWDTDAAVYIELGPEGEDDPAYLGVVARYLLVGGGGAGGGCAGGGGGAGRVAAATGLSLSRNVTYSVVIGSGGTGTTGNGGNGAASSFSGGGVTLIAAGGGGGGGVRSSEAQGAAGPSGGGAGGGHPDGAGQIQGGAGTSGAGFSGGNSGSSPSSCVRTGGGGGGSTSAGGNADGYVAGSGGNGTSSDIGGATLLVAGGGGGGAMDGPLFNCPTHTAGLGVAGGGNGNLINSGGISGNGQAALPNTGSGGGGGAFSGTSDWVGGNGGSGIFIIRTSLTAAATTGSPTVTIVGGQTVYTFTQSGSITF
jgi:hypothetical protein